MPRVKQDQVEQEMRILAEDRVRSFVGDAPLLSRSQTAKIWGRSVLGKGDASHRARSDRPVRQYGKSAARGRDHRAGAWSVKEAAAREDARRPREFTNGLNTSVNIVVERNLQAPRGLLRERRNGDWLRAS